MIFHVDVDAFFASVEQLRNPRLRGRPVAVGSGVIASCSYEARARGLVNGMPLYEARRRCPGLAIVDGRQEIYRCFTDATWEICRRYAPALEALLDDAYCDFTGTDLLYGDFPEVGRRIRRVVREEVGLAVSVGIGKNRMIAKMATKMAKPDGLVMIPVGCEDEHLLPRPVRDIPGVGPKTASLFRDMNIRTIREFRAIPVETLEAMLGKVGRVLFDRARGEDTRPIHQREIPKTISRETTLSRPTSSPDEVEGMLFYLTERAMRTVRKLGLRAKRVKVTIRYADWRSGEMSRTLPAPTAVDEKIQHPAREMFRKLYSRRVSLRHLGVVLSQFRADGPVVQNELFEPESAKFERLHAAIDRIRDKYGHSAIVAGRSLNLLGKLRQDSYGYILRTPSLTK